jgi:hypothetical protein
VEKIRGSDREGKADAFFTCGQPTAETMQRREKHDIPGQVAMEQIMVCGFGAITSVSAHSK